MCPSKRLASRGVCEVASTMTFASDACSSSAVPTRFSKGVVRVDMRETVTQKTKSQQVDEVRKVVMSDRKHAIASFHLSVSTH